MKSIACLARLAAVLLAAGLSLAAAAAPDGLDNETCLACHGQEGFSAPDAQGKQRNLFIDRKMFEKSVHAPRDCVNCHTAIKGVPHEFPKSSTRETRQLQIIREGCGGCHTQNFASY